MPQNADSWALTPNTERLPLGLFMSVDASRVVRSECVLLWFAGYELYQVITVVHREGEILYMEGLWLGQLECTRMWMLALNKGILD